MIGLAAGTISWFSLNKVGQLKLLKRVDDTFGVLHTHAVAGIVGGLMVGVVANPKMIEYLSTDGKTPPVSVGGLLYTGDPKQLGLQALAAAVIIGYDVLMTFGVLKLVSLIVPLRASDAEVEAGDLAIHGMDPVPAYPLPRPPRTTVTPTPGGAAAG
jgi:Amt family ammonium transporter